MQIQSSLNKSDFPKKDASFLKDKRISITKLYDDMAILLRKFDFSGKKYSPSKISKAREILSRIYNFTQNGQPYVGWWVYMCEKTGLSRPTVMQYFKDFREAGLIRYELTFYKGKPVTYIHTTEVIDCFFMAIASGQNTDNVIINEVMQANENKEETKEEVKDIEQKEPLSYSQILQEKNKYFFNQKTGEYEERTEAQLIEINYFDKKFYLGSEFKVSPSEITQHLDKIFNLKPIDAENNRFSAGSYAYEFNCLDKENKRKIVNYLNQQITAFEEEHKKIAGKRLLVKLYLRFLEKSMNQAQDVKKDYDGIKGLTYYPIHARDFVQLLLKEIKFS